MTVLRIVLAGAAVVALLAVAKERHWFERAGLVSSCTSTAVPFGQPAGGAWYLCREGVLTGFPTLTRGSCESTGLVGGRELWRCPAPLASFP